MNTIITGYYKKNNLGDDLFEKLALQIFSQKKFKNKFKNIKTVPICEITLIENRDHCESIILFGGETLNDYFLDKLIDLHRLKPSIKIYAIGVSCNQNYKDIINKLYIFESIIYRNEIDYKNLNMYVNSKHCSDIVFLNKKNISLIKKNNVGFFLSQTALHGFNKEQEFKYINFLIKVVRYWIKMDYKIYLFAMCTNNINSENDNLINQKIVNNLTDHEKSYIKSYSNNKKILSKITYIKYAICWRFHAHVLCMIYNIPFISISNTPKVKTLLNENNLNELTSGISNYEDKIKYIIENTEIIKNKLKEKYNKNKKSAKLYLDINNYIFQKKENTFYIDKKTYEFIFQKLKDYYEKYKTNDNIFNAQIIIFFLMKDLKNEYLYGLQEKIYKPIEKLKDDIYWLINECIINKNLIFYESVSVLLNRKINPSGCINIKFINQNDYKGLHRSGWQYVVDNLEIFHGTDGILCDLNIDRTFHWNYIEYSKLNIIPYTKNWIGFIHHTCNTDYSIYNTINLFKKKIFIKSLEYCKGLIVMSEYLGKQIEEIMKSLNINVKVYVLYHPTEFVSEDKMFMPKKFTLAIKKKIVQIGAWMRNVTGINDLDVSNSSLFLDKYVLKGKNMENYYEESNNQIITENNDTTSILCNASETSNDTNILYACISRDNKERKVKLKKEVYVIGYQNNEDYDKLLSESIVFLNLIDASAVNTVIECIVRNTPIFVNRLDALEEILGKNYPLFYNDISEVSNILTMEYLDKGYTYLKNLNKNKLSIQYFMNEFKKMLQDIKITANNKMVNNNESNA